jgi:hypothetical protein
MSARFDRRAWLQAALALATLPMAEAGRRAGAAGGPVADLVPAELEAAASRLGVRCRAAGVPADEAALIADFEGQGASELAAFLAERVRADFRADRLVAVGPWWLAATEARVLALC